VADAVRVELTGLQPLMENLSNLASLVSQKRILSKALREGAQLIAVEAEHLAPALSGRLRASITVQITEATASSATARIGPSQRGFYGMFNEFGTKHMASQPFLGPAFDAKADEAQAVIAHFLKRGIEREIKRETKAKK
jgi:HK97 gp10 family phage protein